VRRISAEAGVSMGLINHHFGGIDGLVAAAYEELAGRLLARSSALALATAEPRAALHAFFAASFAPEALDPALFRTWLVFWSLVPHAREMRAVREHSNRETRALIARLLERLQGLPGVALFRAEAAAIGLSALMDGLWVELSLNPASFAAAEAIAACDDWVHALTAGSFPSLRTTRASR
jgi:TetR/AcrR family transcriptional regulator, transcriptional repressor of bet genes